MYTIEVHIMKGIDFVKLSQPLCKFKDVHAFTLSKLLKFATAFM